MTLQILEKNIEIYSKSILSHMLKYQNQIKNY
jgi:hypothetical protein